MSTVLTEATLTDAPAGDVTGTDGILTITIAIKAGEDTASVAQSIVSKVTTLLTENPSEENTPTPPTTAPFDPAVAIQIFNRFFSRPPTARTTTPPDGNAILAELFGNNNSK